MVQHADIDHTGITGVGGTGNAGTPYEVDYVEFTSAVSPNATTEATANTVVTANAVAFDGSTIAIIEFWAFSARPDNGAAIRNMSFYLYDGSSSIGRIGLVTTPAAQLDNKPVHLMRRLTPSNASHTYSIRAAVSAGTGSIGAGAGGNAADMPGFIRISKLTV